MRRGSSSSEVLIPREDPLFKTPAAARFIGLKKQTLDKWRSIKFHGQPPYLKIGSLVYYRRSSLEKWLEKRTVAA